MIRKTLKRISAITLAAVIGFTGITNYDLFDNGPAVSQAAATDADRVVFAEGAGTGRDFSTESWTFKGVEKDGTEVTGEGKKPGIEADTRYLKNNQPVIRLINGVRSAGNGKEAADDTSYTAYRSGEAFLSEGIMMDTTAKFSVKFTFSMPEAVTNVR